MRLSEEERAVIKAAIMNRFSSVDRILLFGSRVDDTKRGGGDRRIDLVLGKPQSVPDERPIAISARREGVPL
jgi:hypothetical protein